MPLKYCAKISLVHLPFKNVFVKKQKQPLISLIQSGKFPVQEAIRLFLQACAGMGYAHRAGLIHCDVKPHNMLITANNRLKITDFGIARALASVNPNERTTAVWGSPAYFSPEQAAGEAPSPASDVYSLGVVLYEMLTGQLPFVAPSALELARMHRFSTPIPPRELNPAISPTLEKIILKVLSKEPAARYRTADQLGRILINFTQTTKRTEMTEQLTIPPIPIPNARAPKATRNDIEWNTVFLGLLALAAVGGLLPFWLWVYYSLQ
ncbi:MAG: hypothetical protein B5M51_05200 [Anaerolinea sp. 4484_236]|nr:MAG: hypothetical protein B5M51_05200 [Anaerolinea sp. 4484_236]